MTNAEFKNLLKEAFNTHTLMKGRDYHTVNELMYCLRYDERFKELNINISIEMTEGEWWAIPTIDSFVNINTLGIWFDDDKVEFEHEVIDDNGYLFYCDNLTIYEREEK